MIYHHTLITNYLKKSIYSVLTHIHACTNYQKYNYEILVHTKKKATNAYTDYINTKEHERN